MRNWIIICTLLICVLCANSRSMCQRADFSRDTGVNARLFTAIARNDLKQVNDLLEPGADANATQGRGQTVRSLADCTFQISRGLRTPLQ